MSDRLHYGSGGPIVPAEAVQAFAASTFLAVGVPTSDADLIATTLVHADLRGVHSHGLRMINVYIEWLENGVANPDPHIRSQPESVFGSSTDSGELGHDALDIVHLEALETGLVHVVG